MADDSPTAQLLDPPGITSPQTGATVTSPFNASGTRPAGVAVTVKFQCGSGFPMAVVPNYPSDTSWTATVTTGPCPNGGGTLTVCRANAPTVCSSVTGLTVN